MKTEHGAQLGNLLGNVHLGGVLDECVLELSKGIAKVNAIDLSNSIFLSCSEAIADIDEKQKIGIGNLAILCKYLEGAEQVSFTAKEAWLVVKKKGCGQIKVKLLKTDAVPTALTEKEDTSAKLLENADISIKLFQG